MRRCLVIGSGKRIAESVLPALESLGTSVDAIFARSSKFISTDRQRYEVRPISSLEQNQSCDLLYLAVPPESTPECLARLTRAEARGEHLVIDTPIVHWRRTRALRLPVGQFSNIWAGEDSWFNPFYSAVRQVVASGAIGKARGIFSFLGSYRYHGLASFKFMLGATRLNAAWVSRLSKGHRLVSVRLDNRTRASFLEPRLYDQSRFIFYGSKGTISDFGEPGQDRERVRFLIDGGAVRGIELGQYRDTFSAEEAQRFRAFAHGGEIGECMHALKAVAVRRMLQSILEKGLAYRLEDALEDTLVDGWMRRLPFYHWTLGPKSAIGRQWLRLLGANQN